MKIEVPVSESWMGFKTLLAFKKELLHFTCNLQVFFFFFFAYCSDYLDYVTFKKGGMFK
jgi:hypothetical protein